MDHATPRPFIPHATRSHGDRAGLTAMAASATLHCLTGCAVGEILGLALGSAWDLTAAVTIGLSVGLAFLFGYVLSTLPLLRAGLAVRTALGVVLAADTLSILTMEVVDNTVMATVPGALEAGLPDPLFWASMALALAVAFGAAFPVNRHLLARGRGHALTHAYHQSAVAPTGLRRLIPDVPTTALAVGIAAFLLGGLVAATADDEPSYVPQHGSITSHG